MMQCQTTAIEAINFGRFLSEHFDQDEQDALRAGRGQVKSRILLGRYKSEHFARDDSGEVCE